MWEHQLRCNETGAHRQGSYLLEAKNILNNVLGHLLQLLEKLRKVTQAFIKSSCLRLFFDFDISAYLDAT